MRIVWRKHWKTMNCGNHFSFHTMDIGNMGSTIINTWLNAVKFKRLNLWSWPSRVQLTGRPAVVPASVLVYLSSGLLPGGPVMSPIKRLDIFFKLYAWGGFFFFFFHSFCRASFKETFNLKKCSLAMSQVIYVVGSVSHLHKAELISFHNNSEVMSWQVSQWSTIKTCPIL